MLKLIAILLGAIMFQMFGVAVHADMVILKSGEMFQTSKAWRKDGKVHFYYKGKVVRYPENDVERVIESAGPEISKPPTAKPPEAEPPSPVPRVIMGHDAGYLGLRWEQAPSAIKGLTPAGTDSAYGGVKLYTFKKPERRFGRARVDNVFLGFWQGGLYTILIEVSNYLDFTDLKAEALRRFGRSKKDGGEQERYRWSGPVSDRLLAYDDDTGTGFLWMRSHALHKKVRARYPE